MEITDYWVINTQHSCFSDVAWFERRCNLVKAKIGISWLYCTVSCSFTHVALCVHACKSKCVQTYLYRQAGREGKEAFYCKSVLNYGSGQLKGAVSVQVIRMMRQDTLRAPSFAWRVRQLWVIHIHALILHSQWGEFGPQLITAACPLP